MAKSRPIANLINLGAWLTGILVSLAVGFGMADTILTVRYIPEIVTIIAGWIVIILTIATVVLAIIDRF
jgi:hypothetical protein